MPFIRKRDLTKKQSMDTTHSSVGSQESSQMPEDHSSLPSYQQAMEVLSHLHSHLEELDLQNWEKETHDVLAFFLDQRRTLLSRQQLEAYR